MPVVDGGAYTAPVFVTTFLVWDIEFLFEESADVFWSLIGSFLSCGLYFVMPAV